MISGFLWAFGAVFGGLIGGAVGACLLYTVCRLYNNYLYKGKQKDDFKTDRHERVQARNRHRNM